MILQLDPPIPLTTPRGKALSHFVIDYGMESHLYWVCFIDDSGECWVYANTEIRALKNITIGRNNPISVNLRNKETSPERDYQ